MSTLSKRRNSWMVRQWCRNAGKQVSVTFACNKETAERAQRNIEKLFTARDMNTEMPAQVQQWLQFQTPKVLERIEEIGLISSMVVSSITGAANTGGADRTNEKRLHQYLDEFKEAGLTKDMTPADESTVKKWEPAIRRAKECFPDNPPLSLVDPEMVQRHVIFLQNWIIKKHRDKEKIGQQLEHNTRVKDLKVMHRAFDAARRLKLIAENPYGDVKKGERKKSKKKKYIIPPNDVEAVMGVIRCPELRFAFACWIYLGMRHREVFELYWKDVDRAAGKIHVYSSKNRHHDTADRETPIRDLLPFLDAVFVAHGYSKSKKPDPHSKIIQRWKSTKSNLHTQLKEAVIEAGLEPWPGLIQNCRSTCINRWLRVGVLKHLTLAWAGHDEDVQDGHYSDSEQADFDTFNGTERGQRVDFSQAQMVSSSTK